MSAAITRTNEATLPLQLISFAKVQKRYKLFIEKYEKVSPYFPIFKNNISISIELFRNKIGVISDIIDYPNDLKNWKIWSETFSIASTRISIIFNLYIKQTEQSKKDTDNLQKEILQVTNMILKVAILSEHFTKSYQSAQALMKELEELVNSTNNPAKKRWDHKE